MKPNTLRICKILKTQFAFATTLSLLFILILFVFGIKISIITIFFIVVFPIIIIMLINPKIAFYLIVIWSFIMFFISRLMNIGIPIGVVIELIFFIAFLGIVYRELKVLQYKKYEFRFHYLIILIWVIYLWLMLFNPQGYFSGWLTGFRKELLILEVFILGYYSFNSITDLKYFTITWILLLLTASFYCFYQEIFGLPEFEYNWVTSDEKKWNLYFQFGRWRLWSIMNDPTTFGIISSYGVVFTIIFFMYQKNGIIKIILLILSIIFLISTALTGTRTAYIIIPIGLIIFILINLDNYKTVLLTITITIGFLLLLFGPFHGNTARRVRSAFFPKEDASFNARERNRNRIQPYIYTHPFGGGMNTSGYPGRDHVPYHELAGFPPDSYYLKLAIETGFIGLLINLLIQIYFLLRGINVYYRLKSNKKKGYLIAYISSFIAMSIAGYAQEAINQFPNIILFFTTYVIIEKIEEFN